MLNYNYFIIFFILLFLFSGCTSLKKIDETVGELLFDNASPKDMITSSKDQATTTPPLAKDLSAEQKQAIDVWLNENGYNRYGDPFDMMYAGGTPLFNEATGERIERFGYILKQIPGILDNL